MTHFLKSKRTEAMSYAALKLDMSKANDTVESGFLERVMIQLGFRAHFMDLIRKYMITLSYMFKINGDYTALMVPGRALTRRSYFAIFVSPLR